MHSDWKKLLIAASILLMVAATIAAEGSTPVTISEKVASMQKFPGYFNFYRDEKEGKLWLEIDKLETEFLYIHSLPAGLGSNDIGLDRSQLGRTRVVKFVKSGPKILLMQPNYNFRATTENSAEERAVQEAFATSVLWGFTVAAEQGNRFLVDATNFLLQDVHDVIGQLERTKQGNYRLDRSRSAFYWPRSKNFPQNTEIEVILTFTGKPKGNWVREVAPTPTAITVRQHHSFVQLPEPGYAPRAFDPRAGYFPLTYADYATPIGTPIRRQLITRHRLQKKDPRAARSEPVEPIVYYVDNGTPEPIRSALIEGASWWNQAFEKIGFVNAFRVAVLPDSADPMDVRYNVIQWVHRSTRGWSYGSSVRDPRTGEILKGHVLLGSLRVRQDYLIAQGLLNAFAGNKPEPDPMLEMALARLRQLAAHEVGHTLGLAHNFAASSRDRASVMDYPHPRVKINADSTFDLSDAYAVGIGAWDEVAIAYGYSDFPAGTDTHSELQRILRNSIEQGMIFISDPDARPAGGAHPQAHLWDNGTNAIDELAHVMRIRQVAIKRFSQNAIPAGTPFSELSEVFVPVYLFHRYQAEAVAKLVGGNDYTYALRGDGQTVTRMLPAQEQRRALAALLQTISPEALAIPEKLLDQLPPKAYGTRRTREDFAAHTGVTFDPLATAEAAARLTLSTLLHPQRAARLVVQHARDPEMPSFLELADHLLAKTWYAPREGGLRGEVHRIVDNLVLYYLQGLVSDAEVLQQVRAGARLKLRELEKWLHKQSGKAKSPQLEAHSLTAAEQIENLLSGRTAVKASRPLPPPAGSPIGAAMNPYCGNWQ